jgi:hypothetical protein
MAAPDNKRVENAQIAQPGHGAVVEMQRLMELEQTTPPYRSGWKSWPGL